MNVTPEQMAVMEQVFPPYQPQQDAIFGGQTNWKGLQTAPAQNLRTVVDPQPGQWLPGNADPRLPAVQNAGNNVSMPGSREAHESMGINPVMRHRQPFSGVAYRTFVDPYGNIQAQPMVAYPSQYPHVVSGVPSRPEYGMQFANAMWGGMAPPLVWQVMPTYGPQQPKPAASPAAAPRGGGGGGGVRYLPQPQAPQGPSNLKSYQYRWNPAQTGSGMGQGGIPLPNHELQLPQYLNRGSVYRGDDVNLGGVVAGSYADPAPQPQLQPTQPVYPYGNKSWATPAAPTKPVYETTLPYPGLLEPNAEDVSNLRVVRPVTQ